MTVGGDARFMGVRASRLGVSQRAGVQGAPRIVTESHSRSAPPPIPSRVCVPVLRLRAHTARCPIPGSGCPLGETGVGGRGSVPVGVSAPRLDFSLPSPCGVWGCIPLRYACTCVCACVRVCVSVVGPVISAGCLRLCPGLCLGLDVGAISNPWVSGGPGGRGIQPPGGANASTPSPHHPKLARAP